MGCDIHAHYEVKNADGEWEYVDWRDKYRDYDTLEEDGETGEYEPVMVPKLDWHSMFGDPLYVGRNYNLFSVLADVRNGYGFAGVYTGEQFVPIASPRGVPNDATPEYREEVELWGRDGHSHSYVTLRELMDYDWEQTRHGSGIVNPGQYLVYKAKGRPMSWAGDVFGGDVKHITNTQMDTFVKENDVQMPDNPFGFDSYSTYTRVSWEETYRDAVGGKMLDNWLTAIRRLAPLASPEDIRVIFFFDN